MYISLHQAEDILIDFTLCYESTTLLHSAIQSFQLYLEILLPTSSLNGRFYSSFLSGCCSNSMILNSE